jgi:hypothetical protein
MLACVCVFGCARAIFYLGVFLFLFNTLRGEFKLSWNIFYITAILKKTWEEWSLTSAAFCTLGNTVVLSVFFDISISEMWSFRTQDTGKCWKISKLHGFLERSNNELTFFFYGLWLCSEGETHTHKLKPMLCILYTVTVIKLVQCQMMCESRDLH